MAAKKNNPKREARLAKNDRNLNRALTLFTAGFIAEFYLLMLSNYFVKGTIDQMVAVSYYLDVMIWVGAAVLAAGVVLLAVLKKHAALGRWLTGLGVFFAFSSLVMRKIYPAGTTAMCVLVPVLMLLAVVFLLYPHEFAVQTVGLAAALAAAVMLNHGSASLSGLVKACCWGVVVMAAALAVFVAMLQKQDGMYKGTPVFPAKANYTLTYAVLAVCAAAVVLSLFVGAAYYVIWGAAVLLFLLAVWYTVKML